MTTDYIPQVGDTAEYTFPDMDGKPCGDHVTGTVVEVGKTYADVDWATGRTERIRFRAPDGVTFKATA